MSWKHGIQTSKRTDSLIGLTGLALVLAIAVAVQVKQPTAEAAAPIAPTESFQAKQPAARTPATTTPAPETDEYRVARGFAIIVAYHVQCAKIPSGLQTAAGMAADNVPLPIRNAAMDEVSAAIRTFGAAKFCTTYGMDVARMVMSGR